MIFKKIGSGLIPAIGIGTAGMGGKTTPDYSNDEFYISRIKKAIDMGFTHIDTAEIYGGGHTEELVGKAIRGITRDELFITTKAWKEDLSYSGIVRAAEGSLGRMKIKNIDLYLIHFPDFGFPIKETMKAMCDLVDMGIAKNIGVSNFSLKHLIQAQACSKYPISANQVRFNLLVQPPRRMLEYAEKNNIIIMAYSPLARGRFLREYHKEILLFSRIYNKTPYQIALNWLSSKPNVVAITSSVNDQHIMNNISSVGWDMKKEHTEIIERFIARRNGVVYRGVECIKSPRKLAVSVYKKVVHINK